MDTDDIVELHRLEATVDGGQTVHRVFSSDSFHEQVQTWRPVRHLKSGGAGDVWAEVEDALGTMRAVKTINKAWMRGRLDYRRELLAMGVLSKYPHAFVKFQGWFEHADNLYISMELISGGDLSDYLATHGARPESEGKLLSFQIFRALELMHLSGFTHRDLKPQNIFIVSTDPLWIKLGDFGISKRIEHNMATELRTRYCTPEYAAPEVLVVFTGSYSNKVDIWSAGCIIFEILMGIRPRTMALYERPKDTFLDSILAKELKDSGITNDGIDLMMNLLCWQPEDRFSAEEAKQHRWTAGWNIKPIGVSERLPESGDKKSMFNRDDLVNAKEKLYSIGEAAIAPSERHEENDDNDDSVYYPTYNLSEKVVEKSGAENDDDNGHPHAPNPIADDTKTQEHLEESLTKEERSQLEQINFRLQSLKKNVPEDTASTHSYSTSFSFVPSPVLLPKTEPEDTSSIQSYPEPFSFVSSPVLKPITKPEEPVKILHNDLSTPPSPSSNPAMQPASQNGPKHEEAEHSSFLLDDLPEWGEFQGPTPLSRAPPKVFIEHIMDLAQGTELDLSLKTKFEDNDIKESYSAKEVMAEKNMPISHSRSVSLPLTQALPLFHESKYGPVLPSDSPSKSPSASYINPDVSPEASQTSLSDPQGYDIEQLVDHSANLSSRSRSNRNRSSRYKLSVDSWKTFIRRPSPPGHPQRRNSATAGSEIALSDPRRPAVTAEIAGAMTQHEESVLLETNFDEHPEIAKRSSISNQILNLFPPGGKQAFHLNGDVNLAFINDTNINYFTPKFYKPINVIILGDGASGKTRLGVRMSTSRYEETSPPTTGTKQYTFQETIEQGLTYSVAIYDTGSASVRPLLYAECDVAVVCFDVSNRDSMDNCYHKWIPEVQHFMPHTPYAVVGCQADRRRGVYSKPGTGVYEGGLLDISSKDTVSFTEGIGVASNNGAKLYAETSALTGMGVKELSQRLVETVVAWRWQKLEEENGKDRECRVM